jgi:hypothetical protein
MKRRAFLHPLVPAQLAALMLCACAARAAQDGPTALLETPILWKGVEVITNDFDSVARIREVAALRPDTLLLISDPKLQAVCDAVRKELPASKVVCSNVISATPGGSPTAWYLVEVDIREREPLICSSGATLSDDLVRLHDAWQAALGESILKGTAGAERVSERKYLDYEHVALSSMAAKLHAATEGRAAELEAAASSCDARQRAMSFYLMSFVGEPRRFVRLAGAHINDPDVGAANAATRFLAVFASLVSAADIAGLAAHACRSLQEGGFAARNKSLMLLNAWGGRQALSFAQLGAECQKQVRDIARTSVTEQIGLPARELVRNR